MANLKTLKPFQKGHDPRRNTKGRPISKWARWKDAMEKELKRKVVTPGGSEITAEIAIIMKLIENARKGDLSATKLYFDYRFGKPPTYCARCERRNEQAHTILEERQREEERQFQSRFDLRAYMKHIIEKGTTDEKRELMQSFTSQLILINKRVVIE